MTQQVQDTYPKRSRGNGQYQFNYFFYSAGDLEVLVAPANIRPLYVLLPAGYYTVTRTGLGASAGGYVTITNMEATDQYMREQLAIKYPSGDWATATYEFVAMPRVLPFEQPKAQSYSYSGTKTETADDYGCLTQQQLNDKLSQIWDLDGIWEIGDNDLTKNYLPKSEKSGTMSLVDSSISDDGITANIAGKLSVDDSTILKDATCTTLEATTHVTSPLIKMTNAWDIEGEKIIITQISETIADGYLMKVAKTDDPDVWNAYMSPDIAEGGIIPVVPMTYNVFAKGDGSGSIDNSKLFQIDDVGNEIIATTYRLGGRSIIADLDVVVGRALNLDGSDYVFDLESTYATNLYLKVVDVSGARTLTWAETSGNAVVNVNKNTFPIGDGEGGLMNSTLLQNPTSNAVSTTSTMESYGGLQITSSYTGKHTKFLVDNAQELDWNIYYNLRNFSGSEVGVNMPLYIKKVSDKTLVLYAAQDLAPEIIVDDPALDKAVATWVGHSTIYDDKHIKSNPVATLTGDTLSNATMAGEVIIDSTGRYIEQTVVTNNVITLDPTVGCAFTVTFNGNETITLLPGLPIGNSITIDFIKGTETADLVWPADWKFSFGFRPNTSAWLIGSLNKFSVTKATNNYHAIRVRGGGNNDLSNTNVVLLGVPRDRAPLNFYDTTGYLLEYVTKGEITENKIDGMAFTVPMIADSRYSDVIEAVFSNGTLDVTITKNSGFAVRYVHNEDINQMNFNFDTQTIPTTIFFRFTIIILPGVSTQTEIPLPTDVYKPDGDTSGTVALNASGSILEFIKWQDGDIVFMGGNSLK